LVVILWLFVIFFLAQLLGKIAKESWVIIWRDYALFPLWGSGSGAKWATDHEVKQATKEWHQ
jgi:hypothetical protein